MRPTWTLTSINWQRVLQISLLTFFVINSCIFSLDFSSRSGKPVPEVKDETQTMDHGLAGGSNVTTLEHILPIKEAKLPLLATKSPAVSFVALTRETTLRPISKDSEENRTDPKIGPSQGTKSLDMTTPSTEYKPPWSWSCGDDGKCHRVKLQKSRYVSLEYCWLTCGATRGLWPKPRSIRSENHLRKTTTRFMLNTFRVGKVHGPSTRVKQLATQAFDIMKQNLKFKFPSNAAVAEDKGISGSILVSVRINSPDGSLNLLTDETYRLRVTQDKKNLLVSISGETFFGVRHGLETLSQLIAFDDAVGSLQILNEVDLSDGPAFPYRGLMIDSGRNFIPIDSLRRMIDGMGQNKLNILHWHLTDSDSFPLFIPSLPQMTNYGAYSKDEIYRPHEVRDLIQYALLRGVKIIPEIDAPSHAGNGWQWGNEENGFGQLALCINEEPFNQKCGQPPCGQLNPANPMVYDVLFMLYSHALTLFDSDLFHMGGDEVRFDCWETMEIRKFMKEHQIPDFMALRTYFQNKAYEELKMAASTSNSSSNGKRLLPIPIIWTSDLTASLSKINDSGINPTDYIVQTWEGNPSSSAQVRNLLEANFPLIISNLDKVYLDLGSGTWLGKGHDWRYINWQELYEFDFDANGYNTKKRVTNSRFGKIPQILGGEAPLWTEKVNEFTMDAKLWPRGAAFAERLWLNPNTSETKSPLVYARLLHHNERMKRSGIRVDTRQPKICLLLHGNCENTMEPYPRPSPPKQGSLVSDVDNALVGLIPPTLRTYKSLSQPSSLLLHNK